MGAFLAVKGVIETSKLFGQTPYRARLRRWVLELARILGPTRIIVGSSSATIGGSSVSGRGKVRSVARGNAISERLRVVEENVERLDSEVDSARLETQQGIEAVRQLVQAQGAAQQGGTAAVAKRLEEYSTGSLDLELVGAFWVIVGQAYTTFPNEIAAGLLKWATA